MLATVPVMLPALDRVKPDGKLLVPDIAHEYGGVPPAPVRFAKYELFETAVGNVGKLLTTKDWAGVATPLRSIPLGGSTSNEITRLFVDVDAPDAVPEKMTFSGIDAPGLIKVFGTKFVTWNGGSYATAVTFIPAVPMFLIVTVCGALVIPMG